MEGAGAERKVVGVGEYDLGTERRQVRGEDALDRGLGADRHEGGRLDITMGGDEAAEPRAAMLVLPQNRETLVHGVSKNLTGVGN